MVKKKVSSHFELIELMLVKPGNDFGRTFTAEIYRETTKTGESIVRGNVVVNEGQLWSSAETQEELRKNLDDICLMKLDFGLHSDAGVFTKIFDIDFFLN